MDCTIYGKRVITALVANKHAYAFCSGKNEKELKSLKNAPRTLHQTTKRCFSYSPLTELMEENTKQAINQLITTV